MRSDERAALSADGLLQRELRALDAALAGGVVPAEHDSLAKLARELRELRVLPHEEFAATLDARAAQGFRRTGRPRRSPAVAGDRGTRARLRRALLAPAAGLGALAAVVAVLVVLLAGGSGHHSPAVTAGAAASRPAGVSSAGTPSSAPPAQALDETAQHAAKGTLRAAPPASGSSPEAASSGASERQVERAATLELGVAERSVQSAAKRVFSLVETFGGYVRRSNVGSGTGQSGATFDIRVPSVNLAGAIAALSDLGRVRAETNTTNDVTDRYGSLERDLGSERAARNSLLAQLSVESEAARAAALRARLRAIESRIRGQEGALKALRARVDYTSLALSLSGEAAAASGKGDLTPGGAAHDALRILDGALAVLVLAAAALLPLAAVLAAVWLLVLHTRRRLREQALDAG
jgi:Domain of unknown function (DUF4349)